MKRTIRLPRAANVHGQKAYCARGCHVFGTVIQEYCASGIDTKTFCGAPEEPTIRLERPKLVR